MVLAAAGPILADMIQAHAVPVDQNDNSHDSNNIQGVIPHFGNPENVQGNQP
jgi:hypothetical protein